MHDISLTQALAHADKWYIDEAADRYRAVFTKDSQQQLGVWEHSFQAHELGAAAPGLADAARALAAQYVPARVAHFLRCVYHARTLPADCLFSDTKFHETYHWQRWVYMSEHSGEITLLADLPDGLRAAVLSMPEPVWELCYPEVLARFNVATAMGMGADEAAGYCQPSLHQEVTHPLPDNLKL